VGTEQSSDTDIRILVEKLAKFRPGKPLDKFISYAVFPHFKNIRPNTRVDFEFPLTVIVGPNGTGKSSLLHAVCGMPEGETVERFWFSTSMDAIDEGGDLGQHRFFYGHWFSSGHGVVETRKARVTKAGRSQEYWEPTKAVASDGMQKLEALKKADLFPGRSKDRWNPVRREILFLNFKSELSAYDKYMYFGREPGLKTIRKKQDKVRQHSHQLRLIVDQDLKQYDYFRRPSISENRKLSDEELSHVSAILGRKYASARVLRHRFFEGHDAKSGLSVLFEKPSFTYSEAHAGSGEVAVVSAVTQILSAPHYSLILLDEPEVSLHPGAQRRLLRFLLEQIKTKHHQVLICTHSREFLRGLPEKAIKLMEEASDGKFDVLSNVSPSSAFEAIGSPSTERLTVYVEDRIAEVVVKRALQSIPTGDRAHVDVVVWTGGAEAILTYRVPTLMTLSAQVLVYLDGDKRPTISPPSSQEVADADLRETVRSLNNLTPQLLAAGQAPDKEEKELQALRRYLDWYRSNVRFLPLDCPDLIALKALYPNSTARTAKNAKEELLQYLKLSTGDLEQNQLVHIVDHELRNLSKLTVEFDEIASEIGSRAKKLNA
jgi:energy-coupling factor transporter ATP-binding protein EcfA2